MITAIYEVLDRYGMDGIDFVPLFWEPYKLNNQPIYKSYTKEEFKKELYIIKSNYYFWKMVDGKKEYYDWNGIKYEIHN